MKHAVCEKSSSISCLVAVCGVVSVALQATPAIAADPLPDSAWSDGQIVFDAEHANNTYELTEASSATGVTFLYPATLIGSQVLTLNSPAEICGTGSLLVPLTGTGGLNASTWSEKSTVFASTTQQTVWRNQRIGEDFRITGAMCGSMVGNTSADRDAKMFYPIRDANGDVTVQMQCIDGTYVKAFKLKFTQSGADVQVQVVWARYGAQANYGKDLELQGNYINSYTTYATTRRGTGIGITDLQLQQGALELEGTLPSGTVVANADTLTVRPRSSATISNRLEGIIGTLALKGENFRVTFEQQDFLSTSEVVVADPANVSSVDITSFDMSGNWVNERDPTDRSRYAVFRKDVAESGVQYVDMYVQYFDYAKDSSQPDYTKVVRLRFAQRGTAVKVRAVGICSKAGRCLGEDSSVWAQSENVATTASAEGYGLHNVSFSVIGTTNSVAIAGSEGNSLASGMKVVADGIAFTLQDRGRLPSLFDLEITNNAAAVFDIPSQQATHNPSCAYSIAVRKDCVLTLERDWNIDESALVMVDGGRLVAKKDVYLERATLCNGAEIRGLATSSTANTMAIRVGYHNIASYTRSEGVGANEIATSIMGVKAKAVAYAEHIFDTTSDLLVSAPLKDLPGYEGLTWKKTGPAQLTLSGVGTTVGAFVVEAGTLNLAVNNALSNNDLTLNGSSLVYGATTNTLGALTLAASSSITVGTGCLSFGDSSAKTWATGAKLTLIGTDKKLLPGRVRFPVNGVTREQLSAISYNDTDKVVVDDQGWVVSYRPPLIIIVK